MACNSCSNSNGIIFPDFVSNACCNPCCENQSVGGTNTGCGCGCGNVGGANTGCGSVGGTGTRPCCCRRCCGNNGNVSSGNCSCTCGTGGCICTCD